MSISYTQFTIGGDNLDIVVVDDYPEENAIGFEDLWVADVSATNGYRLLDGTIDTNPDTFSLDTAVRPADDKAVPLKISCTARAGATCDITGTDAWGNALSETGIDISSGSATTANRFASVDTNGVTVNDLQEGDEFDLFQDRWGWISKNGETYQITGLLLLGNGTNATYFKDTLKQVHFTTLSTTATIQIKNNAYFILGNYANNAPSRGCSIKFNVSGPSSMNGIYVFAGGTFSAYASHFISYSYDKYIWYDSVTSSGELVHCVFSGIRAISRNAYNITDCMINNCNFALENSTGTIENVFINGAANAAIINRANCTFRDIVARNCPRSVYFQGTTDIVNLIDCDFNNWAITWVHNYEKSGYVNRQSSFNLLVQDEFATPIVGASVRLIDKDGTELFNGTTDSNGQIEEQIVTYQKYTKNGTLNQTITTTYSPHTVTISKPGYVTKTIIYTMDRRRDEVETLSKIKDLNFSKRLQRKSQ